MQIKGEATLVGWTIVASERTYDFSAFKHLKSVSRIAMLGLIDAMSNSEQPKSRARTNLTTYKAITHYLRFLSDRTTNGESIQYDLTSYYAYESFLKSRYRPTSASATLNVIRRLYRYAMDEHGIYRFSLPRAPSHKAALLLSKGALTLADQVDDTPSNEAEHTALNRLLIETLSELCWKRIHLVRDRFSLADKWRAERIQADIPAITSLPPQTMHIAREDAVRIVVEYIWQATDGYLPQGLVTKATAKPERQHNATIRLTVDRFLWCRTYDPPLTIYEICDYLQPSHAQIAPFMPIFAMKGINPVAIAELEIDMLRDNIVNPDTEKLIVWPKGRVHGELKSGPYMVGARNSKTVPQAWAILAYITSGIRDHARHDLKNYLFLCVPQRKKEKGPASIRAIEDNVPMRIFNKMIMADDSERFAILRTIRGGVTLKAIRTTQGNIQRFTGDINKAQKFFQHKSKSTTFLYLNNPQYKDHLNDAIATGQADLFRHLGERPTIVSPKNISEVASEQLMSEETALALVKDEYNNGFGISLVSDKAYVVDNPINYRRMTQWLAVMEASEERLFMENPDRWEGFWMQQIEVFRFALEDFPRKTRAAADKLGDNFLFPEPH